MENKVTLTIGIPAFNEEQNIQTLLETIMRQKQDTFNLEKILVYSDASSDKTNQLVEEYEKKYSQIELIKGKEQKGKYSRMNELFALSKTDILIILDADIALGGNKFIEYLVTYLISDSGALSVSARNVLLRPQRFEARMLYTYFTLWDNFLLNAITGDIPNHFTGTATAFKGSYASTLRIPPNVNNPHHFLYLAAKSKNGFRYCAQAVVLQHAPATISELNAILTRKIMQSDSVLEAMFGKETIQKLHYVPKKAKVRAVLKSFLYDPLYTPLALLITIYASRMSGYLKKDSSQLWKINTSTKRAIAYEE